MDVERLTTEAHAKLAESHTIKLKNARDVDGIAEFWILLSPGPKVSVIKFISGDEPLRMFAGDLEVAAFPDSFPDATDIKIPRRGKLSCSHSMGQCSFLLISAETVRSAN
jgi:hypothetical protein